MKTVGQIWKTGEEIGRRARGSPSNLNGIEPRFRHDFSGTHKIVPFTRSLRAPYRGDVLGSMGREAISLQSRTPAELAQEQSIMEKEEGQRSHVSPRFKAHLRYRR